jgi:hypothetical protein
MYDYPFLRPGLRPPFLHAGATRGRREKSPASSFPYCFDYKGERSRNNFSPARLNSWTTYIREWNPWTWWLCLKHSLNWENASTVPNVALYVHIRSSLGLPPYFAGVAPNWDHNMVAQLRNPQIEIPHRRAVRWAWSPGRRWQTWWWTGGCSSSACWPPPAPAHRHGARPQGTPHRRGAAMSATGTPVHTRPAPSSQGLVEQSHQIWSYMGMWRSSQFKFPSFLSDPC